MGHHRLPSRSVHGSGRMGDVSFPLGLLLLCQVASLLLLQLPQNLSWKQEAASSRGRSAALLPAKGTWQGKDVWIRWGAFIKPEGCILSCTLLRRPYGNGWGAGAQSGWGNRALPFVLQPRSKRFSYTHTCLYQGKEEATSQSKDLFHQANVLVERAEQGWCAVGRVPRGWLERPGGFPTPGLGH